MTAEELVVKRVVCDSISYDSTPEELQALQRLLAGVQTCSMQAAISSSCTVWFCLEDRHFKWYTCGHLHAPGIYIQTPVYFLLVLGTRDDSGCTACRSNTFQRHRQLSFQRKFYCGNSLTILCFGCTAEVNLNMVAAKNMILSVAATEPG